MPKPISKPLAKAVKPTTQVADKVVIKAVKPPAKVVSKPTAGSTEDDDAALDAFMEHFSATEKTFRQPSPQRKIQRIDNGQCGKKCWQLSRG